MSPRRTAYPRTISRRSPSISSRRATSSPCGARGGGLRLARPPEAIGIGEVIRSTEETLALAECFDPDRSRCPIAGTCALQRVLGRALNAFLAILDEYTLVDLLRPRGGLGRLLFTECARSRPAAGRRRVA